MDLAADITPEDLEVFLQEADEQLQLLDEDIVRLEREHGEPALLQEIFRAAHTLKGSSAMVGHQPMAELAHGMESLLDRVRKGSLEVTTPVVDTLLHSLDLLKTMRDDLAASQDGNVDIAAAVAELKVAASITEGSLRARARVKRAARRPANLPPPERASRMDRVLVIGSSTGGPRALSEVIPLLPGNLPAGILLVQHMPPGFTRSLAERLNQASEIDVKEAETGDQVRPGQALPAPGGYHMIVTKGGKIELNQGPQVCGVRPSVDVTMESVVQIFGSLSMGVVLTGMGSDGTRGASLIKAAGGKVAAEDESTCAVYGMPRSIVESGHADTVVPLPRIAREIVRMCAGGAKYRREAKI